jgi:hypothetical protein
MFMRIREMGILGKKGLWADFISRRFAHGGRFVSFSEMLGTAPQSCFQLYCTRHSAFSYGVTDKTIELVLPPSLTLMVALPFATPVAKPLLFIVATPGLFEVHVTLFERS